MPFCMGTVSRLLTTEWRCVRGREVMARNKQAKTSKPVTVIVDTNVTFLLGHYTPPHLDTGLTF
jgi:hypothetical protein